MSTIIEALQKGNVPPDISPLLEAENIDVKINANIGTSPASCDFENEIQKRQAAIPVDQLGSGHGPVHHFHAYWK